MFFPFISEQNTVAGTKGRGMSEREPRRAPRAFHRHRPQGMVLQVQRGAAETWPGPAKQFGLRAGRVLRVLDPTPSPPGPSWRRHATRCQGACGAVGAARRGHGQAERSWAEGSSSVPPLRPQSAHRSRSHAHAARAASGRCRPPRR